MQEITSTPDHEEEKKEVAETNQPTPKKVRVPRTTNVRKTTVRKNAVKNTNNLESDATVLAESNADGEIPKVIISSDKESGVSEISETENILEETKKLDKKNIKKLKKVSDKIKEKAKKAKDRQKEKEKKAKKKKKDKAKKEKAKKKLKEKKAKKKAAEKKKKNKSKKKK